MRLSGLSVDGGHDLKVRVQRIDVEVRVESLWRRELVVGIAGSGDLKSLGRIGLLIHATAGFIDPGFHGKLTLELSNVAKMPIALYSGMKIGQIAFLRLSTPAERLYGDPSLGSKYQGQMGPAASRAYTAAAIGPE